MNRCFNMRSRRLPRALALLLLVTSTLPGTAAEQQWESPTASKGQLSQPQLRVLAVPLLPTSPTMDMMAVAAELKARCVRTCMQWWSAMSEMTLACCM